MKKILIILFILIAVMLSAQVWDGEVLLTKYFFYKTDTNSVKNMMYNGDGDSLFFQLSDGLTDIQIYPFPDSISNTGFVPYTGADSTLNMGTQDIIVDTLKSMSLHEVSPEGLVLGMNFNTETISGSTVYDASFYGNHGTIYNATADSSAGFNSGGAITFTGADTSYVEIADGASLDITDAITLMAWAKDPPTWLSTWSYRQKITVDYTKVLLLFGYNGCCGTGFLV